VLVDAAAYVPTQPLDLSQVRPDFVGLSFYKMFGYPTGLGALLVRVDAAEVLNKVGKQGRWPLPLLLGQPLLPRGPPALLGLPPSPP
jgi:selenocysteine lyase/cysteine desulfurase